MAFLLSSVKKQGLFIVILSLLCSLSLSTFTVHELKSRFWPISDPNTFGIASKSFGTTASAKLEKSAGKTSGIFTTEDGRPVVVFDDVLDYRLLVAWEQYIHLGGIWRFQNGYSENSGISWTATFDAGVFKNSETGRRILSLVKSLPKHHGKGSGDGEYKPYKVVCNILRRGDVIKVHRDADKAEGEFTAILYLNQLWRQNDYGDLLLYEDRDIFSTVSPKFNRVIIWDSSIEYLTRPPSMGFKQSQLFLMVHFTRNQTKVEEAEQTRRQLLAHHEKAAQEVFPSMVGAVPVMDVGKYVTQKYTSANGKKIYVFDDLFSKEDLDKLRTFTVDHGNYFFDDSIDADSDNVQWIAAFSIDNFTQTTVWNITRQVAKYVSGTDEWFPYDVACNVIRSFDYTRIHEDCEVQEDEWTFLIYLNPNWTGDLYGETVFKESKLEDAENIASVLPRYGRVALFQGIIPHSARPPSTMFTEARLSFAVKLSVNPVVARLKMWKQEFTHEEYMHQSTLALLKYYNDPNLEGYYKKLLLEAVKEQNEVEYIQRQEFLKGFQEGSWAKADYDHDEEDEEEFEFEENRPFDIEFQEINRRRKYIFSLFKKFGDDAEALTTHYMQFVQDNQVMKKMYVKEMEQLI
ncbi:uncharacterized protein LOC117302311 [Asterias rubens]|uniref:uncharacterized protein LOC117302311 n=1 Tax=Asterias rubens TaxID=7604 RepID=UPI001455892B|nr:uncharacterized protein LOC117302311 [Asterias rubens]